MGDNKEFWDGETSLPADDAAQPVPTKGIDDILEVLAGVVQQACLDRRTGELDSMALSFYADGIRLLAEHGKVTIKFDVGRRVIATWVEEK